MCQQRTTYFSFGQFQYTDWILLIILSIISFDALEIVRSWTSTRWVWLLSAQQAQDAGILLTCH